MGKQDKYHKWFHVNSSGNNAVIYTVNIFRVLRYTCEYFVQRNTPFKHIYIL